jgi:type IV pilus assembly protein PilM
MPLFQKTESFVGVDIGAHGMKVVELRKNKNRPQLWTYGAIDEALDIHATNVQDKAPDQLLGEPISSATLPPPTESMDQTARIDHYAKLLKEVLKRAKVTSRMAVASLPVSYVFHTIITLPQLSEKEVLQHVEAKISKLLPRPASEMQVVHQTIPQTEPEKQRKNMRVLVTAAPKEIIQFYTRIFERAGLHLAELETEAFALERSLVGRDTSTVLVVDMGAERTNFFIMDQGLPVTHRSIQIGGTLIDSLLADRLGVKRDVASDMKHDLAHVDPQVIRDLLFAQVIEPMMKEVQYGFELYLRQTGNEMKRPEKIILTGGSALIPAIQAELSKTFPLKVFIGDPWARVVYQQGLKPVLDAYGPRMAVAIGLALRNIV